MQSVARLTRPTAPRPTETPTPYAKPFENVRRQDCYFYHTFELSNGEVIEGGWDLRGRYADYIGHVPLEGARVLDVGTASGFLSFSAEEAGAREVVSFDLDTARRQHLLPFAGSLYMTDHEAWVESHTENFKPWKNAYWYTHKDKRSKAKVAYGDVYDLPKGIGSFDVVILGAIIEHLGDPVRAIGSISKVARDRIVINTDYIEGDEPLARFNGIAERPASSFIFWTYTIETYRRILAICGFEIERVHKDTFLGTIHVPGEPRPIMERAAIVARRIK